MRDIRDTDGEPLRVLQVGGVYQSATYLGERRFELPFEYYRAIAEVVRALAFEKSPSSEIQDKKGFFHALFIGGGGCSVPKHLVHECERIIADVIEIDPRVVEIARNQFYVDEVESSGRLNLLVGDGLDYLRCNSSPYDVIVNDAFDGGVPAEELLSGQALGFAKQSLCLNGVYVLNLVCEKTLEGEHRVNESIDALKRHFEYVHLIPAADEAFSNKDNIVLVASDIRHSFEGALEI